MPRDIQREDALRAFPGHDGEGKNVDARDIGAKQSFVALPGHGDKREDALCRLRARPNFLNRINLIWAVQSHLQK